MLRKGFTIAELIVVIAIIIIVSGISFAIFSKSFDRSNSRMAAEAVKSFLEEARSFAIHPAETDLSLTSVKIEYVDTTTTSEFRMRKVYSGDDPSTIPVEPSYEKFVKTLIIDDQYDAVAFFEYQFYDEVYPCGEPTATVTDPYSNIRAGLNCNHSPRYITFESPSGRVTDFYNGEIPGAMYVSVSSDEDTTVSIDPITGLIELK